MCITDLMKALCPCILAIVPCPHPHNWHFTEKTSTEAMMWMRQLGVHSDYAQGSEKSLQLSLRCARDCTATVVPGFAIQALVGALKIMRPRCK